jgi:choline dehydrogenase-like flavoprotein
MDEFDVAIVGAGAAGAILAARLSENNIRRVILVEAGSDTAPGAVPEDIQNEFPVAYSNPAYFWPGLAAVARSGGRENAFPQARVMGGGSSVMGMWALRGAPDDYDAWRAAGAIGWGWDDVLPFFRKLETDRDYSGPLHGKDGPIPVRRHGPEFWPLFIRKLVEAAQNANIPLRGDINGDFRDGVFPVPVTNNEKGRVSSAIGYLTAEVRRRRNLTILTNAEAKRVLFAERRANGLELTNGERILCHRVVLSAGAIGSPALLWRSGIGPAPDLVALGISPIVDLPGVGGNLQNHCIVNLAARIAPAARQNRTLSAYALACARLSSGIEGGRRGDLQLQFITKTSLHPHGDRIGLVGAALYAPLSRGRVSLTSPDPAVAPRIEFRLLEKDADQLRLRQVIRLAMQLLSNPNVRQLRDEVFTIVPSSMVRQLNRPGRVNSLLSTVLAAALNAPVPIRRLVAERMGRTLPEARLNSGDADDALADVSPIFHPAGTCAIGRHSDPLAVLDPSCHVRGVAGLSVVDASIMPLLPTGNTCLPTMMAAERAAEFLFDTEIPTVVRLPQA